VAGGRGYPCSRRARGGVWRAAEPQLGGRARLPHPWQVQSFGHRHPRSPPASLGYARSILASVRRRPRDSCPRHVMSALPTRAVAASLSRLRATCPPSTRLLSAGSGVKGSLCGNGRPDASLGRRGRRLRRRDRRFLAHATAAANMTPSLLRTGSGSPHRAGARGALPACELGPLSGAMTATGTAWAHRVALLTEPRHGRRRRARRCRRS
jgi:hypothetical protein